MNIKSVLLSLLLSCCFCFNACSSLFFDETTSVVVDNISGSYSLVSASFDEAVQLSSKGESSNDILGQMTKFGWYGIISADGKVPLVNNVITPSFSLNKMTQINFYVPVSRYYMRDHIKAEGKCIIDLAEFQFHYKINGDGEVEFHYPDEIQLNEYDTPLKRIMIDRLSPSTIIIRATTSYYDADKEYDVGGHLTLVYTRNKPEVN